MAKIGKYNQLIITRKVDFGVFLDGQEHGEILMPAKYVPEGANPGDQVDVFVYPDSEDRLVATTETPLAQVGEVAWLKVKAVNQTGAFLDWGLLKDLLVPFREQKMKMTEGRNYLVFIYLDDSSQRIVASAKLDKFLNNLPPNYTTGQEVDLIIENSSDLGYTAIINHLHTGIIYHNEVFEELEKGQQLKGYVKKVRPDDKIDLTIYPPGYEKIDSLSSSLLEILIENGGYMAITDKSEAELIYDTFGMSKKNFKKSVGNLYKRRKIAIEANGLRVIKS